MSTSTPIASTSTMSSSPSDPPPRAQLLETDSLSSLSSSLETASSLLQSHIPVAFPTETVYGLGASALSSLAVQRIFSAKGRPSDNPLIVHIGSREMLESLLPTSKPIDGGKGKGKVEINEMYEALMTKFWPGPLSLIFDLTPSSDQDPPALTVAPEVTANLPSLCIRMPSHPLALQLIQSSNLPLAAPSANLSSRPSPTSARHVMSDLGIGRGVGAVLDGGDCTVGLESTVVDYLPSSSSSEPGQLRILRAGGISSEEIESCLQEAGIQAGGVQVYSRDFKSTSLESQPTTPGMKYKHYSPGNSKVVLVRPIKHNKFLPSLQDLIQLSSLTQGKENESFRVGLMLTTETLSSLSPTPHASSSSTLANAPPELERIQLPPPSEDSLFSQLAPNEESNLPGLDTIEIWSLSLGNREDPDEGARRLFRGLRWFDSMSRTTLGEGESAGEGKEREGEGVDLILVECVEEKGRGLAFMERVRKAAGGAGKGGEMEFALS